MLLLYYNKIMAAVGGEKYCLPSFISCLVNNKTNAEGLLNALLL